MSNTDNFVIVSKMFIYSHGKDKRRNPESLQRAKKGQRGKHLSGKRSPTGTKNTIAAQRSFPIPTCKREEKGLGKALPNTEKSAASPISLRPQRANFLLVWISTKQEKGGPQ